MKVTVIGCGNWGSRIARRLTTTPGVTRLAVVDEDQDAAERLGHELGVAWSPDPLGYLLVTGTQSSSVEPGAVVIATPPSTRLPLVRAALDGYGLAPSLVRVEKPLAETVEDALAITDACDAAGATLTVGFTLLHHPLYEAAFTYAAAAGGVLEVRGMRVGRKPAHPVTPIADLGIHTTSIAAFLGVPCRRLVAAHIPAADARRTTLVTPSGDVVVDELALTVHTPDGPITVKPDHDALGRDLAAWMRGNHRGTPQVALVAQDMAQVLTEVPTCAA